MYLVEAAPQGIGKEGVKASRLGRCSVYLCREGGAVVSGVFFFFGTIGFSFPFLLSLLLQFLLGHLLQ